MSNVITVYQDSDYLSLGQDATQDDLDAFCANLQEHLETRFPGKQFDVEQCLGGKRAGHYCLVDEEVDEYVRELCAGDGWIELLPEPTTEWDYEVYWNAVLGATRDARCVVAEFGLECDGLDEWLGHAEEAAIGAGKLDRKTTLEVWRQFHTRALGELEEACAAPESER